MLCFCIEALTVGLQFFYLSIQKQAQMIIISFYNNILSIAGLNLYIHIYLFVLTD